MDDEGEEFSEREMEVAAILTGLKSTFRARLGEIPLWGKRRRRTTPAAAEEKPVCVAAAAAADNTGEGACSPVTPLAFLAERGDADDDEEKERGDEAAAAEKKAKEEQRGVVASLSHENARLVKVEFNARLQSSRSTNDSLKKIQSKHKKRSLPQREEKEDGEDRKRRLHAAAGWPALGLDLNEPVAEAEPFAAAQWPHHRDPLEQQHKAALTAAARRRRQLIRRAKAAAAAGIRTGAQQRPKSRFLSCSGGIHCH